MLVDNGLETSLIDRKSVLRSENAVNYCSNSTNAQYFLFGSLLTLKKKNPVVFTSKYNSVYVILNSHQLALGRTLFYFKSVNIGNTVFSFNFFSKSLSISKLKAFVNLTQFLDIYHYLYLYKSFHFFYKYLIGFIFFRIGSLRTLLITNKYI